MLNRLARRERRDVDLLLDAGHRLRRARAGVLHGAERETFEDARRNESDARKRLRQAAERLLRDARGSASASLRATGFDAFAGIDLPKPTKRAAAKQTDERRRAAAALRELEQRPTPPSGRRSTQSQMPARRVAEPTPSPRRSTPPRAG